jgi:hypothetical protein
MGKVVADYMFRLADGSEERVPIRERFEISSSLGFSRWFSSNFRASETPFCGVTSNRWVPQPRYEGKWEQTGYRQTEVTRNGPTWYHLWAWENPKPGQAIRSLEIAPKGYPFIVAAITLGHREEHPFVRQERRPVRVTLTKAEEAARPFNLDVQVDRGVATYIHTLPKASPQRFMGDPFKGWGEAQNTQSSPAYVEIAAIPSATVEVKDGDRSLGKVNWGTLEEKGTAATPRVRLELLDRGKTGCT